MLIRIIFIFEEYWLLVVAPTVLRNLSAYPSVKIWSLRRILYNAASVAGVTENRVQWRNTNVRWRGKDWEESGVAMIRCTVLEFGRSCQRNELNPRSSGFETGTTVIINTLSITAPYLILHFSLINHYNRLTGYNLISSESLKVFLSNLFSVLIPPTNPRWPAQLISTLITSYEVFCFTVFAFKCFPQQPVL